MSRANLEELSLKMYSIYGRLSAVNAKKIDLPHPRRSPKKDINLKSGGQFGYSIADLLNDVKNEFRGTFSEDVYKRLGTQRQNEKGFTEHLLFSKRIDYGESERAIIANALESVPKTAEDKPVISFIKNRRKIDRICCSF